MGTILNAEVRKDLLVRHRGERDGRVRDRIEAVLLRDGGISYGEIARVLFLSDEGVRQQIEDYLRQNGKFPNLQNLHRKNSLLLYLHIPQKSSSMRRPPNRQLHATLLTPFCQLLRCKGYKGAYPTQNVSMRPRPRDSTFGGKATYIQAALDRGLSCRQFRKGQFKLGRLRIKDNRAPKIWNTALAA
jgi:hypothetical protein